MNLEQELLTHILKEHLPGEDQDNLKPDDDLIGSGILDSLAMIKLVFADYRTQYTVSSANGHLYTGESIKNLRRPIWFGYIGNGSWSWLGTGNDWTFDLAQISPHGSTLNPASMADKYDLPAQPLPQSWQSAVGQEHIDALLAELSKGQ